MFEKSSAFSGFSVDDIPVARSFYGGTLGLVVSEENGMLSLHPPGGSKIILYPKGAAHQPASFTVLNFPVPEIEGAVEALVRAGVELEHYAGTPMETDSAGIFRKGGPLIAWFRDPAGNVLSVIQE
ncbi:VOC family protein [Arthrobacter psychrochitiniphilus]|uniref:Glyoxalase n=1 Tax=Arthrobacter psychrochitiniphilus TaxID=291045 RepID=A0A2V3DRG9_9MICC|nr:VOC family protein [Arthrobacter psychrochitiniphilus]NYG17626.1 catechol 2,3-dioxygenase-like lactoylglutathione lyase family enzyme [Arthrobacter psychrochitiniphilus]PXA65301.1 glyoxalase [Arthrobacter psychrochitiniphilus]